MPATMSTAQAVTALDQFLQWLNAVPPSWFGRKLIVGDATEVKRPTQLDLNVGEEQSRLIAWPAANYTNAIAAWEVLSQAARVLVRFPFAIDPSTNQAEWAVDANTIQLVRSFTAKAARNLGIEIPASTGVTSGVAWWKVVGGLAAAALVVGGGFYLIRKYADRPSVERYATPPQPRSRPIYASW